MLTDISPWPGQAVGQTSGGVARELAAHDLVWLINGVLPPLVVVGWEWLKRGVLRLK